MKPNLPDATKIPLLYKQSEVSSLFCALFALSFMSNTHAHTHTRNYTFPTRWKKCPKSHSPTILIAKFINHLIFHIVSIADDSF